MGEEEPVSAANPAQCVPLSLPARPFPARLLIQIRRPFSADATIAKRPIPHAPIASPYAGPSAPKMVYVSRKSPFMSVVKRVQKLLAMTEKRRENAARNSARAGGGAGGAGGGTGKMQRVAAQKERENRRKLVAAQAAPAASTMDAATAKDAQTAGDPDAEPVFVKATGMAIERALAVGKWFEQREGEYSVAVKTGNVVVVDDIVENEQEAAGEREKDKDKEKSGGNKRKNKRKLAVDEDGEALESRTRFVNSVEVSIALKP